jgi:hypothetical protein
MPGAAKVKTRPGLKKTVTFTGQIGKQVGREVSMNLILPADSKLYRRAKNDASI